MAEQIKLWARVGASFKVDKEAFLKDPEGELTKVLQGGRFVVDGESYIPTDCLEEVNLKLDEINVDISPVETNEITVNIPLTE